MESHAFELMFIYTGLQLLVDYSTTMDSLQVSVDRWKTVNGYWSLNHCYWSEKLCVLGLLWYFQWFYWTDSFFTSHSSIRTSVFPIAWVRQVFRMCLVLSYTLTHRAEMVECVTFKLIQLKLAYSKLSIICKIMNEKTLNLWSVVLLFFRICMFATRGQPKGESPWLQMVGFYWTVTCIWRVTC